MFYRASISGSHSVASGSFIPSLILALLDDVYLGWCALRCQRDFYPLVIETLRAPFFLRKRHYTPLLHHKPSLLKTFQYHNMLHAQMVTTLVKTNQSRDRPAAPYALRRKLLLPSF